MYLRQITVEKTGDITVATLRHRKIIDEVAIEELNTELVSLVTVEGCRKLIVDFQLVEYYSDAGLRKLILLGKKMKAANGMLRFCSIQPTVYDAFVLTRLNQVFDIRENREQAINGM